MYLGRVKVKKARKSDPYEIATTMVDKYVERLVAEGWEVVSHRGGNWGNARTYTLRRPNPKYTGTR